MAAPARVHGDLNVLHAIRKTVSYANATTEIGTIPSGAVVVGVHVDVTTVFNAGTTNVLKIGTSGTNDLLMAAGDIDESTAGGYAKVTAETLASDTTFNAYFSQTGTAATTGAADVTITYYPHST